MVRRGDIDVAVLALPFSIDGLTSFDFWEEDFYWFSHKDELFASRRSQLYLVKDTETGVEMVMKTPSINFEEDSSYIDRFIQEEWIRKRIDSDYVVNISKGNNADFTRKYYSAVKHCDLFKKILVFVVLMIYTINWLF